MLDQLLLIHTIQWTIIAYIPEFLCFHCGQFTPGVRYSECPCWIIRYCPYDDLYDIDRWCPHCLVQDNVCCIAVHVFNVTRCRTCSGRLTHAEFGSTVCGSCEKNSTKLI